MKGLYVAITTMIVMIVRMNVVRNQIMYVHVMQYVLAALLVLVVRWVMEMKFISEPIKDEGDENPLCCDHNIDCYGCINGGCVNCYPVRGGDK